jgi:hypothetical protein
MTTYWLTRHEEVAQSPDSETWDRLSAAFDEDWRAEYREAFVTLAVSRGWDRAGAESWPNTVCSDALLFASDFDYCPKRTAEYDVLACEMEEKR